MTTTRLSIDMSRRVPMGATRVDTEVVRDGKRIQAIEARYVVDDEIVGRATAMRVRIAEDLSVPNPVLPEDQIPSDPHTHPVIAWTFAGPLGFRRQFRLSPKRGRRRSGDRLDEDGEAVRRGRVERSTGAHRAVADMIPSGGSVLDYEQMISINADLVISLHRPPEGEWLGFTAAVPVKATAMARPMPPCSTNGAGSGGPSRACWSTPADALFQITGAPLSSRSKLPAKKRARASASTSSMVRSKRPMGSSLPSWWG